MSSESGGYHWEPRVNGERFGLTPRQMKVFAAWVMGKLTEETAEDLGISYNTVESHRTDIVSFFCEDLPDGFSRRQALTRAVIGCVVDRIIVVDLPDGVRLTRIEGEIGGSMLKGMNAREAAKASRITCGQAVSYFSQIYDKLGLSNYPPRSKYVPAVAKLTALAMKQEAAKGDNC